MVLVETVVVVLVAVAVVVVRVVVVVMSRSVPEINRHAAGLLSNQQTTKRRVRPEKKTLKLVKSPRNKMDLELGSLKNMIYLE